MKDLHLRLLSYMVIAYMLIAFAWWSVLLFKKNEDAFLAKSELLRIVMTAKQEIKTNEEFVNSQAFLTLKNKYKKQEWMIFGEASVFVLSLVIGIYLINRAYHREMKTAENRRNFLLSITHELKSPIASIKLVLETFLKRNLSKEQSEPLTKGALKESVRLNSLVNNLLLAARVEEAYQPVLEPLDLNTIIKEVVEDMQVKFPNDHISFDTDMEKANINGDHFGWTSIVINLIENAVKYSPSPANIDIKLKQNNKNIEITFADQGYGIPKEEKKKVFNQFYRIGSEDTRKTKGTGLGLYIVDQIIKAHKGKITIHDNSPQGTKFNISMAV